MVPRLARGRWHYAWVITAVTFVTLLITAGIRATPSVLILPLEQEFGWSRLTVSTAVSINLLVYGLTGPFAASLMDRFGIRRMIVIALLTGIHADWQLYLLWGVVVAGATGSTAIVLGATIANRWFVKSKGVVMGILSSANAAGQMLFLPPLAIVAVTLGWRSVMLLMGAMALIILPL